MSDRDGRRKIAVGCKWVYAGSKVLDLGRGYCSIPHQSFNCVYQIITPRLASVRIIGVEARNSGEMATHIHNANGHIGTPQSDGRQRSYVWNKSTGLRLARSMSLKMADFTLHLTTIAKIDAGARGQMRIFRTFQEDLQTDWELGVRTAPGVQGQRPRSGPGVP